VISQEPTKIRTCRFRSTILYSCALQIMFHSLYGKVWS